MNSELRTIKIKELKTQLRAYQLLFPEPLQQSKAAGEASYRISHVFGET